MTIYELRQMFNTCEVDPETGIETYPKDIKMDGFIFTREVGYGTIWIKDEDGYSAFITSHMSNENEIHVNQTGSLERFTELLNWYKKIADFFSVDLGLPTELQIKTVEVDKFITNTDEENKLRGKIEAYEHILTGNNISITK